jgi:hypothetical protein
LDLSREENVCLYGLPSKAIALRELTVSLDTVGNSHVAAPF